MTLGWPLGVHLKAADSKTLVFNSPIFGSDCRSGSPVAGETSKRTGDVPTGYATQHTGLGVKLQRSGNGHGDGQSATTVPT